MDQLGVGDENEKQKIIANVFLLLQLPVKGRMSVIVRLGTWFLKSSSTESNPDRAPYLWPLVPNILISRRGWPSYYLPFKLIKKTMWVNMYTYMYVCLFNIKYQWVLAYLSNYSSIQLVVLPRLQNVSGYLKYNFQHLIWEEYEIWTVRNSCEHLAHHFYLDSFPE